MATTWPGRFTSWLPASFSASISDDLRYDFKRSGAGFNYSVDDLNGTKLTLPVDVVMGGQRHGIGFLISIEQIDGIPLARPALIQARYAWSPERKTLLVAPGCAATKPQSLEPALGLVLSPTFQSRCLSCHGQPNLLGSGRNGGVHCESCHGPGSEHLVAVGRGNRQLGIVNPKRLSAEDAIGVCAPCHVGLAHFSDPSPDDLLIANQVVAIKSSECFLQSRKSFSCTACHDPHSDASTDNSRAVKVCLGCHASGAERRAAICPVNAVGGCTGCHMPSMETGPLHLVDHLIRVHPEQKIALVKHDVELRTQTVPVSVVLRMITTDTAEAATTAYNRVRRGESFYQVARESSVDRSAAIGGYLGRKSIADLGGIEASEAARLVYGETSEVFQSGSRWVILQRLPRDYRWDAEQVQLQAEGLAARGDARAAIQKAQEALMIYPRFLRALDLIGNTFANSGNAKRGAEVLATAARLYPEDAQTEFALASALNVLHDQAGAAKAYERAIALEADFTAAYANLGMIGYSSGDWPNAIKTFRRGLQIDPLSAELYYDLSLALTRMGDASGASQATALARKLDPGLIARSTR